MLAAYCIPVLNPALVAICADLPLKRQLCDLLDCLAGSAVCQTSGVL